MTKESKPELTHFLVVGNAWGWGKDVSEKKALAYMRKYSSGTPTSFNVYKVSSETYVNEIGSVCWPQGHPDPVLIRKHPAGVRIKNVPADIKEHLERRFSDKVEK